MKKFAKLVAAPGFYWLLINQPPVYRMRRKRESR